eukprot:m.202621 g.202621  ORF g.202621 m.202621 type:complete len:184 (+) comp17722_c4_seq1:697-1248(+)
MTWLETVQAAKLFHILLLLFLHFHPCIHCNIHIISSSSTCPLVLLLGSARRRVQMHFARTCCRQRVLLLLLLRVEKPLLHFVNLLLDQLMFSKQLLHSQLDLSKMKLLRLWPRNAIRWGLVELHVGWLPWCSDQHFQIIEQHIGRITLTIAAISHGLTGRELAPSAPLWWADGAEAAIEMGGC